MPRAGLSPEVVTRTATEIVNREGGNALTLARVAAELGVRSPSLYNHVDGLEALERSVALSGIDQLAEICRSAVMGRSGLDALRELATAYRSFARNQPGVYAHTQIARPDDSEFGERTQRVLEPVVAVMSGFGLKGDELIHAARTLRAALHGFASLENGRGFGLDVDVDVSFGWMVEAFGRGLSR
jgi:AcrR family transcriptional regulator